MVAVSAIERSPIGYRSSAAYDKYEKMSQTNFLANSGSSLNARIFFVNIMEELKIFQYALH